MSSEYRRGVEDSIKQIVEEMPLSGIHDAVDVLNAVPRFLRKKLLTKKAVKWVLIYGAGQPKQGNKWSVLGSAVYDSFTELESAKKSFHSVLGSTAVEIEVPVE